MLNLIVKTYDIQLKSIWLQKEVRKKPHWAEEHNLEFNEQKHRWMKTGIDEIHQPYKVGDKIDFGDQADFQILDIKDGQIHYSIDGEKDSISQDSLDHLLHTSENKITGKKKSKPESKIDITKPVGWKKAISKAKRDEKTISQSPSFTSMGDIPGIEEYIWESSETNSSIIRGEPTFIAKRMKSAMKPMQEERILYRGIDFPPNELEGLEGEEANVGSIINLMSFASCSRDPSIATDFSGDWSEGTFLEIQTTSDTLAITTGNKDLAKHMGEGYGQYETMLDYGQRLEIFEIGEIGSNTLLRCKVISNA